MGKTYESSCVYLREVSSPGTGLGEGLALDAFILFVVGGVVARHG